jgi:hypothetical protein
VDGFDGGKQPDGARFGGPVNAASVFVPDDVNGAIPVRVPAVIRSVTPGAVEVSTAGHDLTNARERRLTLIDVGSTARRPAHFKRIGLRSDNTWRPALYIPGSAQLGPSAYRSARASSGYANDAARSDHGSQSPSHQ